MSHFLCPVELPPFLEPDYPRFPTRIVNLHVSCPDKTTIIGDDRTPSSQAVRHPASKDARYVEHHPWQQAFVTHTDQHTATRSGVFRCFAEREGEIGRHPYHRETVVIPICPSTHPLIPFAVWP
ncbi:hypothetical protein AB1N83_006094 [Pleurotus pulmonarius]